MAISNQNLFAFGGPDLFLAGTYGTGFAHLKARRKIDKSVPAKPWERLDHNLRSQQ